MTTVRIASATTADIPACAQVIAEAFCHDPVIDELIPGDRDRVSRLATYYTEALRAGVLSHGTVDAARIEDGPIVAVAIWEPPHQGKRPGLGDMLRSLPLYWRVIGFRHLLAARKASTRFAANKPTFPHWYLSDIAVSDRARGLGVGSALLTHRLEQIDQEPFPVYLEATTPGSQRLYERFGFEAVGRIDIASGPMAMVRQPVHEEEPTSTRSSSPEA